MEPFIVMQRGKKVMKLNKQLYPRKLLERVCKEEPAAVIVGADETYLYVHLSRCSPEDYFSFLNYLIYQKRSA